MLQNAKHDPKDGWLIEIVPGRLWDHHLYPTWDAADDTAKRCVTGDYKIIPGRLASWWRKQSTTTCNRDGALIPNSSSGDLRWFVVRTVPKGENKALGSLKAAGFEVYLPQYKKDVVHQRSKKKITKTFPLINRYLFVRLSVANPHFDWVRVCDGVETILGRDEYCVPAPDKDVLGLIDAQADMKFDDTYEAKAHRGEVVIAGSTVIVNKGVFRGFSGHVETVKEMKEVKVMVEFLGGLVPVNIPIVDVDLRTLT